MYLCKCRPSPSVANAATTTTKSNIQYPAKPGNSPLASLQYSTTAAGPAVMAISVTVTATFSRVSSSSLVLLGRGVSRPLPPHLQTTPRPNIEPANRRLADAPTSAAVHSTPEYSLTYVRDTMFFSHFFFFLFLLLPSYIDLFCPCQLCSLLCSPDNNAPYAFE